MPLSTPAHPGIRRQLPPAWAAELTMPQPPATIVIPTNLTPLLQEAARLTGTTFPQLTSHSRHQHAQ